MSSRIFDTQGMQCLQVYEDDNLTFNPFLLNDDNESKSKYIDDLDPDVNFFNHAMNNSCQYYTEKRIAYSG